MQKFIFIIIGILLGLFLYALSLKIMPNLGLGISETIITTIIAIAIRIKFAQIEKLKYGSLGVIIFNGFMIIMWLIFTVLLVAPPLKMGN